MLSKLKISRDGLVAYRASPSPDRDLKPMIRRRARMAALFAAVAGACALAGVHDAAAAPAEVGVWMNETGQGAVEISPCGDGPKLCGHIVWLSDPTRPDGTPKRDIYNPNGNRRDATICGLRVLGNLAPMRDGSWDNGWVYDPKQGKAFNVTIRLLSKRKLEVHGYQGMKLLGKTMVWTRAGQELPSCNVDADQASVN